mmetsp:Transcript_14373/g.20928  ORF Transcript_14373/g.20928 Transcript_14373/m.20928 type:complete len:140 (-) Transcript_14373:204-623(-)
MRRPSLFWEIHGEHSPQLAKVAMLVTGMCPHAADCERMWSSVSRTHTANRAKLLPDTIKYIELVLWGERRHDEQTTSVTYALAYIHGCSFEVQSVRTEQVPASSALMIESGKEKMSRDIFQKMLTSSILQNILILTSRT